LFTALPGWDERQETPHPEQFKIRCPFHNEKTPSFAVNLETGRWRCFGQCSRGGGAAEIQQHLGIGGALPVSKAAVKTGERVELPPIPESEVLKLHEELLASETALRKLDRMGLNQTTVERFKLGWNGNRYAWPVYDSQGVVRNIRLYKPGASGDKVISFTMDVDGTKYSYGSGNNRLFPISSILENQTNVVLLCEGEKDALTANQWGYAAVSVTAGAGEWQNEYCNAPLKNKHVIICYDIDNAGRKGARKVKQLLRFIAASVHIYDIPPEGLPDNGDFTDFFQHHGLNAQQLLDRFITTAVVGGASSKSFQLLGLADTKRPSYNNRRITVDAHVVGKQTTPFIAERGYRITCPVSRGKICNSCGLGGEASGDTVITIPADSKDVLYTIERTDAQVRQFIQESASIIRCPLWTTEAVDDSRSSVEKIVLSTTVDQRNYESSSEYVQQIAYAVDIPIVSNSVYKFEGRMTSHPKDQSSVFIVTGASTSKLSIDTFEAVPEVHEELMSCRPADTVESIMEYLNARWSDLEANVTKIYMRRPIHIITDLVAHSLLRFSMFGRVPDRCWLEGYVGGDTRQGKSEVSKRLHNFYRGGELIVAENTSLAGLLGGAQKLANGEWMVSWGKCPLNDRGWVTIDECQNIPLSAMAALSGMRSSGVAEIDKIRVERVQARTRILWLSNPRSDNLNVDQLAQGIQLVPDVFGRPEDIARLDLVSVVRSRDVDFSVLRNNPIVKSTYSSELCHTLLMFAWSRLPSDIKFTAEAEDMAMIHAEKISKKYFCDIKIVEAMEERIKIARIAGSVAALCYAINEQGILEITATHVEVASALLDRLLSDPAVAYDEYAAGYQSAETVKNREAILEWANRQNEELLRIILTQREMRMFDFQNYAACDKDSAQNMMSFLVMQRAMVLRNQAYAKSAGFVTILRECLEKGIYARGPANAASPPKDVSF
jgi:hypothetical protein